VWRGNNRYGRRGQDVRENDSEEDGCDNILNFLYHIDQYQK